MWYRHPLCLVQVTPEVRYVDNLRLGVLKLSKKKNIYLF